MSKANQGNFSSDIDQSLTRKKFDGLAYVPDRTNLVRQNVPGSRKKYLIEKQQTVVVASCERQWDIQPTVKGPFPLKTTVTDNDYIEWNLAGAGLNGIYNVDQLLIYGTISELSGANGPHRFGPCLLWFTRIEVRSDTDDTIWRTYDFSGNYARFGFLNTSDSAQLYRQYVPQFGLNVLYVGFGAAGINNQLQNLETKAWAIPLYGTPVHFIPPAILGVQAGYSGNLTMRLFMKPLNLMKETALNAGDSFNINPVLRIITNQRGSKGLEDFDMTINWLEQDFTYITCLVLHEINTAGIQAGGGFLPAFGAGAQFDFVPGIAANAWVNSFFFTVRDRPASQVALNEYTLIPFYTSNATNAGYNNVTLRIVRDGTQDVLNVASFMVHMLANDTKVPGSPFLTAQPLWLISMGEDFARSISGGVMDGFMALQTNDIFRFQAGTTLIQTFAATNKLEIWMYCMMQVVADVHRMGTKVSSVY